MSEQECQIAIEQFFQTNYQKLYGTIYKMTENPEDTDDVLQNTFLKAFTGAKQFRGDSQVSTWIYRIAVNEGYRYLKSWNKLPVVSISQKLGVTEEEFFADIEYQPDFHDRLIVEEMREKCLRGFLRCIPAKMRVCFLLKTCLELTTKEIANVMETSEGNVRITLHRGRERLKEMFEYRCSILDPSKPCKCYLWVKYMRDHGYPIKEEETNYRDEELKTAHFQNMSELKKIESLYHTHHQISYDEFLEKIKEVTKKL